MEISNVNMFLHLIACNSLDNVNIFEIEHNYTLKEYGMRSDLITLKD